MEKQKKKQRQKARRGFFIVGFSLLLILTLGFLLLPELLVDEKRDEALFMAARREGGARFYYSEEGGEAIEGLPDYYAKEWETERIGSGRERIYTPLSEIPEMLGNAFVAIEDRRFYRHMGVDVLRTGKAVLNSVFHFSPRFGGSTITQQLIKNIGGEKEQTAKRKINEMLRALSLERRHSKKEILEAYLNVVPMSENRVGVGAAARLYFGKEPSELTLAECAGIAAITKAPAVYAPEKNMEKYLERRSLVLKEMLSLGMIDEKEYAEAMRDEPKLVMDKGEPAKPLSWYTETVLSEVKRDLLKEGYTAAEANLLLSQGGLRIYTAVDPEAQRAAERFFANKENFKAYGDGFSASFVLLSPENGYLRAVIGNIGEKKGNLLLNHATDTLRAPGSALKPIALYAPAIDEGRINEATVFDDLPCEIDASGGYWPKNADGCFSGLITLGSAISRSKNTVAVSLYRMLGAEHIYAGLVRLGISSLVRKETAKDGTKRTDLAPAPLALGELTRGVSLLALTRAYLPLADNGLMHESTSYLLVTDDDGDPILKHRDEAQRVFKETTASVMTHMLRGVVEEGSADSLSLSELVDTAGKTGTSGGARDRFFIGYTPYYLGGVWCGYETGGIAVTGDIHLSAFDAVMKEIHARLPIEENTRSFTMARGLRAVTVCADSGLLPSHSCSLDPRGERTHTVWLREEDAPKTTCETHIPYYYSDKRDGVLLSPEAGARRVSLLHVERDLPFDLPIVDAEYTCRPLGNTPPAVGDRPFYASVLAEGRYAGQPPHGGRPFNALAREEKQESTKKSEKEKQQRKRLVPPTTKKKEGRGLWELWERWRRYRQR